MTTATETKKLDHSYGKGGRKTATARARIVSDGKGKITINDKDYREYFNYTTLQKIVESPLKVTAQDGKVDVSIKVSGGGSRGQAEGIRHAISRALLVFNPEFRALLKPEGFLTRDPRAKERSKFGLRGARRAPQWAKR